MQEDRSRIILNDKTVRIRNLLDLNAHWPQIRSRLEVAINENEISDPNVSRMVEWLIILGDKTLYRLE